MVEEDYFMQKYSNKIISLLKEISYSLSRCTFQANKYTGINVI